MRRSNGTTAEYIKMMLRNRSGRLFIPVIAAYIILTVVCFYYLRHPDLYPDFFHYVTDWCHRIVPMFACWWVLILHDEFVSGEGNELLYIYLSPGEALKAALLAVLAYFAWICIYIGGMQFYFDMQPFFALRLCIEAFFISGVAYLLVSVVRNAGVPILLIVVYCMYVDQRISVWNACLGELYASLESQQWSVVNGKWAVETIVLTAVLYVLGFVVYRRVKKYE